MLHLFHFQMLIMSGSKVDFLALAETILRKLYCFKFHLVVSFTYATAPIKYVIKINKFKSKRHLYFECHLKPCIGIG